MIEKFIVKVIRQRKIENPEAKPGERKYLQDETDQIFEQEFDKMDIGEFAVALNKKPEQEKKDGQQKDVESIKA